MRSLPAVFFAALLLSGSIFAAEIHNLAGSGQPGFGGDGGPASAALINEPFGVCRGPDGTLFFCDTNNHRVRRIDGKGVITTVAGSGTKGYAGDGGPATAAQLNEPYEVRFDAAGNLYFVERVN